ncbi:DegT/DnrJ/EryC1/StrS family aminotransferase [Halofilum ochraceum]|uniref:DegT/DnrJ/EryC1/StrS family aminotransferase n=1 Tax=Halofilum ochraceum TaxID=1611323 RepID=UPI00082D37BF|nr:DegT/DnrJ/EryC1/StrS family aminotransferase [Halofilum ochraceum]
MSDSPIPMVDLKAQYATLRGELEPAMAQAMAATQYILGPNVQAFEREAAEYLGVRHALGCASGTDALHLALAGLGIGPGDEVITTPFTFIATAEAIRYVDATPVFVDVDPQTFNLDPVAVERAITERTRAIMPVHLFGQPADMDTLNRMACDRGLLVVEDCAQSFGATIDGRQTGSLGAAGAFSFFPSKNLGGFGDGGLVTTHDDAVAEQIRSLRNHGQTARYHHPQIGYNSRLDELQAVVLRHKLPHIDQYNAERRRVADRYDAGLADLTVETPFRRDGARHVFHQYTVLTDHRDTIMQALKDASIASAIYYPVPLHRQPAFADAAVPASLPIAESLAERCCSLPVYPELTDAMVDRICGVIRDAVGG